MVDDHNLVNVGEGVCDCPHMRHVNPRAPCQRDSTHVAANRLL